MAAGDNSVFQAARARTDRQVSRDVRSARAKKAASAKKTAPAKKAPPAKKTTAAKSAAKKSVAKKAASATPVGRAASIGYGAGHKIGSKLRTGGGSLSRSNPRRALVAEFLVCFIVLGAGAIVAPQGEGNGIPRLMSKGTGLALLFLFLSLLSAGGEKAAKGAAGLGALVTAGYLFTSPDAANILKWITSFYGANGGRLRTVSTDAGGGSVAADAGALAGQGVDAIIGDIIAGQAATGAASAGAAQGAGAGLPPANPGGANKTGLAP